MGKNVTSIEIQLEDGQVVGATTRVNANLESIEKKAQHLGENHGFEHFAEGVKQFIENPLDSAHGSLDGLISKIGGMGGAGVGLAGAAGIFTAIGVAGYESMEKLAALGRETENVSLRMGLTTQEVGQFTFAAKAAGGDVGTLERLMRGLTMAVEGTDAKSQSARETLKGFGVDIAALKDGTASTGDTLLKVSQGLADMPNVFERNKAALDLFKRGGIDAIPVLMGLRENVEWFKDHGLGFGDEELAKMKEYHEQLARLGAQWDDLKRRMMEPIAAVINVLIKGDGKNQPWLVGVHDKTTSGDSGPGLSWNELDDALSNPSKFIHPGSALAGDAFAAQWQAQVRNMGLNLGKQALDRASYDHTLPGAQALLADAEKTAKSATAAYFDSDKPTDALRKAWEDATAAVAKYRAQVEGLRKKTHKNYDLKTGFDQDDDLDSTYGIQQYMNSGSFGGGQEYFGGALVADTSGWAADDARYAAQLQARMEGEQKERDAQQVADFDAQQRRERDAEKLQQMLDDAAAKSADEFAKLFTGFTRAAQTGGHRGITRFLRGQGNDLEDTVIGNVAKNYIWPTVSGAIPHMDGPLGQLLQGTPFGPKATDPNKIATDANTAATIANTNALRALATSRTGGGGGLVMGDGSGVDLFSADGSALPAGLDATSSPWAAGAAAAGGSSVASDMTGISARMKSMGGTVAAFGGQFAAGVGDPLGTLFGHSGSGVFGGYDGTASGAQTAGAITGLAAAGFAAYQGIAQIAKGGAHNALGGIGTLSSTAAMLDPEPISKAILGGVAIASGLVSMVLGDPKQQRGNQIQQFIEDHAYAGPTPVSYSRDVSGAGTYTDMFGNVRSSAMPSSNGGTTIHIYANDAKSFSDMLAQPAHSQALDNAVYRLAQNGGKSMPAISRAMGIS